jgi:membrane protein
MPRRVYSAAKKPASILWQTAEEFMRDGCPQMAAAISFYTIFSLPPLLIFLIVMIEPFLDPDVVLDLLEREAATVLGPEGAAQIQVLVENVARPGQGGAIATLLGIGAFFLGATLAFAQLQAALNAAWQVGPDPRRGDVLNFVLKRFLSFAMILVIGLLLVVSLVLSAVIGAFGEGLTAVAPMLPSAAILRVVDVVVSFSILTLIFSAMYRFLPDARVGWRPALFGGTVTAVLFTAGKLAIGYYLGQTNPGSAFGAAGSLAMVLIWIYYSSMILLAGAEFTQVWMRRRGNPIQPQRGAVRIVVKQERYEPDETPAESDEVKA